MEAVELQTREAPAKESFAALLDESLGVASSLDGTVEVYLERMEDKNGEAQLSREKARREEAWTQLDKSFQANERVTGVIFGRVKGGFTVDLNGAVAFLP